MIKKQQLTAVILAGGKGRRLQGQDKGLIEFDGMPLIEHILIGITPQVDQILINANRNQDIYRQYGFTVIADDLADFQGPLAGLASALQRTNTDFIVSLPCDCPQVPDDYVERLCSAYLNQQAELAVAHDGQRLQPIHALIPRTLSNSLHDFLKTGERQVSRWYAKHNMALADFTDTRQSFININTQVDKQRLLTEIR